MQKYIRYSLCRSKLPYFSLRNDYWNNQSNIKFCIIYRRHHAYMKIKDSKMNTEKWCYLDVLAYLGEYVFI